MQFKKNAHHVIDPCPSQTDSRTRTNVGWVLILSWGTDGSY